MWALNSEDYPVSVRVITFSLFAALVCICVVPWASGQVGQEPRKNEQSASQNQAKTPSDDHSAESTGPRSPGVKEDEPSIQIYLVGGGRLQVKDVRETNEGIWYQRGSVTTLLDRKRVARIERPSPIQPATPSVPVQDSANWTISNSAKVETFFITKFGHRLPTTAFGQSDLHTRWGLDHRQGIDVGLLPDSREGQALLEFLRSEKIPFLVFRNAVPGVATGPHIHIGNASHRILYAR